ncbi:MAG TPA: hypothetical protein DER05_10900 [Lutibacter sp.]|nr:hypothetical protein [Lutibacter sp.]
MEKEKKQLMEPKNSIRFTLKIIRLDFLFTHHFYCFFGVRESPKVDFFFSDGKRKEIILDV